jgi:putative DNA primase/helicase
MQPASKTRPKPEARPVTRAIVADMLNALKSMVIIPSSVEPPCWLSGNGPWDPKEVVPFRNALAHLPSIVPQLPIFRAVGQPADLSQAVMKPTPDFFNTYALDFDFDIDAPPPTEWLRFLQSVWADDQYKLDDEMVGMLQEWMGYLLVPDTSQQKIGLFVGPTRSGRGTIARLIRALIGEANVAGPSLSGLAGNFGAAPMIGKPLAIIGDSRISRRSDAAAIVERLLLTSGEDAQTIDRKHKEPWTGKLNTRIMLISNEIPRLPDPAGALAARYLVFRFTKSFAGAEDLELDAKLRAERPAIFLWAVEGWHRLRTRGHFVQAESAKNLLDQIRDIASPIGVYVRERLDQDPGYKENVAAVFDDWCHWCQPQRRDPGTEAAFGRDLRTVIPTLQTRQRRGDKSRGEKPMVRYFEGVQIKKDDGTDSQAHKSSFTRRATGKTVADD